MQERVTSVSDIPLTQDPNDFGTKCYVDGLVEFIKYLVSPLTIALQGEWGSGKTSLMNRLYIRLCGNTNEFVGININTWEYSMLSTPEETVVKIIEHPVKALSKGEKQQNALEKFTKWAKLGGGVAFRAVREAAKAAEGVAGSILIESFVKGDASSDDSNSEDISLSDLKDALETAIAEQLDNGKKGVLVFVDDLDRLNPPVAVEILELLKNIFSLNGCIFILAIDYEVVVKGLEPKFGKLTDKNEREFRSFFDKIIQVPLSLPVNNYHPEAFLIKMLQEINYINDKDSLNIDHINESFSHIVEKTVGKNPRAIKRLINSRSLINCISKIEDAIPTKEPLISPDSVSGKIINFAVISIQISYPRIYNLLMEYPDFTQWDWDVARRFKAVVPEITEAAHSDNEAIWDNILSAICNTDSYLKSHESDIKEVIELISNEIANNSQSNEPGQVLAEFLKRSSVTGVGGFKDSSEVNYSQIVSRLHSNVISAMTEKHEDWDFKGRKVTNCGGFNLFPLKKHLQSKLSPYDLKNNRITLRLTVPLLITAKEYPNIQGILNAGYKQALLNPSVAKMIADFDAVIEPLLKKEWFKGHSLRSRFENHWHKNGQWLNNARILFDTAFDFTLPMAAGFEQKEVIDAMVAIHEAVWTSSC